MRPWSCPPRGFTLAEVAVVAAIVGVLAALAVGSLQGVIERARAVHDIDEVEALIRRARTLARVQRRCVRLDVERRQLSLTPLTHASGPPADCAGGDDDNTGTVTQALPAALQLTPRGPLLFNRTGAVVGNERQAVVVTMTVRGSPPRVVFLEALPGTGSVVRRG